MKDKSISKEGSSYDKDWFLYSNVLKDDFPCEYSFLSSDQKFANYWLAQDYFTGQLTTLCHNKNIILLFHFEGMAFEIDLGRIVDIRKVKMTQAANGHLIDR